MPLKRKIEEKIADWKRNSNGKTALLIDGARRVGKSFIVEEFARKNYKSYILIDFNEVGKEITDLFDMNLRDLDSFFMYLSALSALGKGTRFRDYESAFLWLQDSMFTNVCFNSTEPNIGLKLNRDNTSFKMYMGDTGLLISHSFDESDLVTEEIYKKLLFGKLEVNEGMIFENIVAQMLAANGKNLYFYSNSSRNDKDSRMEIDFLLAKSKITSRHNISALEVKSGKNYTLSSLNKFRKKYYEQLNELFVLHTADLREKDGITYLPVYMTGCF